MSERSSNGALAATLIASAVAYALAYRSPAFAALGELRNLTATLLASIPFALAAYIALRDESADPSRARLALLFGGAVVLRLCPPFGELVGSDDAYRYLWDGLVQTNGINPFAHAPDSEALRPLRDPHFFADIFRRDLRTVYPPISQIWFFLSYNLHPTGFVSWKLVLIAHDLAATALLVRLLRRAGQPPMRALLYAWSPLPVAQLAAAGHLDGLLVPWVLLAVSLCERRPFLAGIALGASAMVRPVTALCTPALMFRRPLREAPWPAIGFLLTCTLLVAPYAGAGAGLIESLVVYGEHWRFNGSLFRPIDALLHEEVWFRPALYGVIAIAATIVAALPLGLVARVTGALACYFILAPTIYPWYLLPMVALAVLLGRRGELWAIVLPAAVGLSDLVFAVGAQGGHWEVPTIGLWMEYGVIYGTAAAAIFRPRDDRENRVE